jgi:hypothetical protein
LPPSSGQKYPERKKKEGINLCLVFSALKLERFLPPETSINFYRSIYIYMTPAIATLCLFYFTPSFSFSLLGPRGPKHVVRRENEKEGVKVAIAGVIYIYIYIYIHICIYTQQDATHRNKILWFYK